MDMQKILKQMRTVSEGNAECNMSEAGTNCPVHGMEECSMMSEDEDDRGVDNNLADNKHEDEETIDRRYYQAIKNGDEIPEEVVEPDRFIRYYEEKYGKEDEPNDNKDDDDLDLKEQATVNISFDGPEAEAWINRLSELSGVPSMSTNSIAAIQTSPVTNEEDDYSCCNDCGQPTSMCICHHGEECCPECGEPEDICNCNSDVISFGPDGIVDENANYDYGHTEYSEEGDLVDSDSYMYKAPNGPQRIVKGMLGDNPLIKEDAKKLFVKLKGDYRAYIAEADLAASNAPGSQSPLTATNRDDFEKDPFAGDDPVTDGSRSPLSTIKRQKVAK